MAKWATEDDERVTNDPNDWRWADADGVQNIVDEWELVSSLSSGSLPPYTLVWKAGWQNWLPACQVAELASAIPPDKTETPVAPKLEPGRKEPPPPPIDKYASYQTRDAAAKLLGRGKTHTRPPPPPGKSITAPGSRRKSKTPPPPAMRPRTPLPTLVEAPAQPSTATLIPPGAVPPPPRGVPTPTPRPTATETPRPGAAQTPLPVVPRVPRRKPATSLREEPVEIESQALETLPTNDPPTMPIATPGPIELREKSEPPPSADVATGPLPPVPRPPPRRTPSSFPGSESAAVRTPPTTFWLLIGVGGAAILVMIAVALVLAVKGGDPTPAPAVSGAGGAEAQRSRTAPCTLAAPAKKLAPNIFHGIPPYVSADKQSGRALVGFAASQNEAVGLAIDLETLAVEQKFNQQSQEAITSVVPLTAKDKATFAVDRESGGLRFARSIDAKRPITIGVGDDGFASVIGGGVPRTIWEGGQERRITEPRVAHAGDAGYAVTFRRGGLSGEVVAGWFGEDGARKSELAPVSTSRKLIGTPVIGANDRDILVAFAARPGPTAYWGLQVAVAPHGKLPERAHPFAIPPGGLGAEAISPAVAGLAGGRWLLQWTEGSTGNRQVRIQTLGSDLIPLGDPVILSPRELNAGQGVVWVRGDGGLSLFLVKVPNGHELWGAGLKCP